MCSLVRYFLALTFVLTLSFPGIAKTRSANPAGSGLRITVRIYNYAQVSSEALAKAERQASIVFRQAGLEVIWVDCPLSMEDFQNHPDCQQDLTPTELVLGILPRFKEESVGLHHSTLGFAYPQSSMAHVSYYRVGHLSEFGYASPSEILGHALAHEIGHLLLGSNTHSFSGLMRANWGPKDLESASSGSLLFTTKQAQLIRRSVLSRSEQEPSIQVPHVNPESVAAVALPARD